MVGSMASLLSMKNSQSSALGYRQTIIDREIRYEEDLREGNFTPFLISLIGWPLPVLILVLLQYVGPQASWVLRWTSFGIATAMNIFIIGNVTCLAFGYGYGPGLFASVALMTSAAVMVCNDPKDFQRLEQRPRQRHASQSEQSHTTATSAQPSKYDDALVQRHESNGHVKSGTEDKVARLKDAEDSPMEYFWQPYPSDFLHRLDWSLDLLTSFRGPGWSYRIRTMPPLSKDSPAGLPQPSSQASRNAFFARIIRHSLLLYLILDIAKIVMMYDPFFIGTAPLSSAPPAWLSILAPYPVLVRSYRLLLSCAAVLIGLDTVFHAQPVFYGIIIPNLIRILPGKRHYYTPLTEPFMYPEQSGPFTSVLDHGLAGWWGSWWHQMFRFGASEPGRRAIEALKWDRKSLKARALQVMIAFLITAGIHTAGSMTVYEPTRPFSGPCLFFLLQGVGILAQSSLCKFLNTKALPRWLRRVGNFVVVLVWMYYTAPSFVEDAARGGSWNVEPVPISLFRGLGFGHETEGWWCWHGKWIGYLERKPSDPWWRQGWYIY